MAKFVITHDTKTKATDWNWDGQSMANVHSVHIYKDHAKEGAYHAEVHTAVKDDDHDTLHHGRVVSAESPATPPGAAEALAAQVHSYFGVAGEECDKAGDDDEAEADDMGDDESAADKKAKKAKKASKKCDKAAAGG